MKDQERKFLEGMRDAIARAHDTAVAAGFYDPMDREHDGRTEHGQRNVAELLMLTVSELAEALEQWRKNEGGDPDRHVPEHDAFTVELADAVIRIFDLCGWLGLDLPAAILAKMDYNEKRPYKHGKGF